MFLAVVAAEIAGVVVADGVSASLFILASYHI